MREARRFSPGGMEEGGREVISGKMEGRGSWAGPQLSVKVMQQQLNPRSPSPYHHGACVCVLEVRMRIHTGSSASFFPLMMA